MPTAVLRPNADLQFTGINAVVGAATMWQALSDDSDASYVRLDGVGQYFRLGLTSFTIPTTPAGAMTIAVRYRVRGQVTSGAGSFTQDGHGTNQRFGSGFTEVASPWWNTTTASPPTSALGMTQATVDNLGFDVYNLGGGAQQFSEAYVDVLYALSPSVTALGPTGSITTTSAPAVTWAYAGGTDGGPQWAYQVRVFTAAQYGAGGFDPATSAAAFDTGIVYDAGPQATVGPLANSTTYRAYVRAAQNISGTPHWSNWSFVGFSISVSAAELTSVVATPDNALGRVQLVINRNTGTPAWTSIEVQRSADGGTTWTFVRGASSQAFANPLTIYDYEAPNGVAVQYRARAIYGVPGLVITGAWVSSSTVTWTNTKADWLRSLSIPTNSIAIRFNQLPTQTRDRPQGVFPVIGRSDPVVVSDVLRLGSGSFTLVTFTDAEARALVTLLETVGPMLLQLRPSDRWGSRYITVGNVTERRVINLTGGPDRYWDISYTEVAAPADSAVA